MEGRERGELSGGARQAVELSRANASPMQVAAADALLQQNPLGSMGLRDVDPTAAAVAVAHWLHSVAEVAAEISGILPTAAIMEADNIQTLPAQSPTLVLELLHADNSPREVLTELVREAMAVAEGEIPNIEELQAQMVAAEQQAREHPDRFQEIRQALVPHRVTPLDPSRQVSVRAAGLAVRLSDAVGAAKGRRASPSDMAAAARCSALPRWRGPQSTDNRPTASHHDDQAMVRLAGTVLE